MKREGATYPYQLSELKDAIKKQYEKNPRVRINVNLMKPKLVLNDVEVTIKGVYSNLFQIEDCASGKPKQYTLSYADIIMGRIEIINLTK